MQTLLICLLVFSCYGYIAKEKSLSNEFNPRKEIPCSDCYYYYTGNDYYNCMLVSCKAEIIDPYILFENDLETEDAKDSCNSCFINYKKNKYSNRGEYFTCAHAHCKKRILEIAIRSPNKLVTKHPVTITSCQNCMNLAYAYDCIFYYCRSEILNHENLLNDNPNCFKCDSLQNEEYYNCAYFYCRAEINQKALSLYEKSPNDVSLNSCINQCY